MQAAGFSLDNLSLMALWIAVGFVVDDAIVMIENIWAPPGGRQRRPSGRPAGGGGDWFHHHVISISLIAVFIPLFMMGGVVGRMFREFAVTLGGRPSSSRPSCP